ncbi:MAG: VWA domain-containing protein [Deltaproteobacteria bacterium]|nr:VWA domain-containing protein [Deltaproteobacteria bacterium]MBW1929279.1 VWA domain-containing protein [Deltaproteobacteria bacterium]MBW2126575.1 VWA domain-containing protein [Deltaproteobacteria bacterium]
MRKKGQYTFPDNVIASGQEPSGLTARVLGFGYFLKQRGFRVYQSSIQEALRSLKEVDICTKEDFLNALRANFVSGDLEWAQFPQLFEQYWTSVIQGQDQGPTQDKEDVGSGTGESAEAKVDKWMEGAGEQGQETDQGMEQAWVKRVGYSPVSPIEKVDVGKFDKEDIAVAQLALKRIMSTFKTAKSRRMRRSPQRRSVMDFPRIVRKSLKYGGIPMELFYREKRKRLKRLVILADVSGSMERYARFVIPFLLGLRGVGPRAEVFVFSTSLAHVTSIVRHLPVEKALAQMVKCLPEWSGGTRIGYSLHQFNQNYGPGRLSRRTVVVILSDGWDLGAKELLRREMAHMGSKAYCVIWLNPLAGDPAFQPICQGMQVVLPYVDYFLPANSLESLKRVGHVLSKIMVH